jgi:hypothetical protein
MNTATTTSRSVDVGTFCCSTGRPGRPDRLDARQDRSRDHREDGSVIGPAPAVDADFYLFERQVYGLIEMLREGADGETWIDWREFHAILEEFGLEATPEELVQAYSNAYYEHPDAPMSQFVQANAFLDVEAQITPLGVWLLFVDGMIPPNATNAALASVAGFEGVARAPNLGGIGIAYPILQPLIDQLQAEQARAAAEASAALAGAFMTIAVASPGPRWAQPRRRQNIHDHRDAPPIRADFALCRPYRPRLWRWVE